MIKQMEHTCWSDVNEEPCHYCVRDIMKEHYVTKETVVQEELPVELL